jgi:hypothetical protein
MDTMTVSPLFAFGPANARPAVRRGLLVSVPVGVALVLELGTEGPTKGAIATGALLVGFVALDAPAKTRAAWQAAVAPLVGIGAAVGVLTGLTPLLAVPTLAVVGAAAGLCFAVSLRFAIVGLNVALSVLIAQGLPLDAADALPALLLGAAGGLAQAAFSALVYLAGERATEGKSHAWSTRAALRELAANRNLTSTSGRHAVRFGAALGVGVAVYWLIGMEEHGFWIPLTILFVLRPAEDETFRRLALRALGTGVGLLVASFLSEWLHGDGMAIAIALTVATGLAYGMLTVQYALFTAAITTYAVLLADTLGDPTLEAAAQRGAATVIGIAIAGAAFLLWPNPREPAAALA